MRLSDAIEGYLFDKAAEGYSPHTLKLYRIYLPIFCEFLGNPDVTAISLQDLKSYLNYLQNDYIPRHRWGEGKKGGLSRYAVANHYKAVRSFFGWAEEALGNSRPDEKLKFAKVQAVPQSTFTEKEVKALLEACEYTTEGSRPGQKPFRMRRPTALRDKSLVLLLLETGLRVGETCRICIEDINLTEGEIFIVPYGTGQKSTSRFVYLGKKARRALWLYLARKKEEEGDITPKERLFDLHEESVRSLLKRLGERAGVKDVHPHRFRHTFAINFLRNGGNVFALQKLLGHSDLTMVRRYLDMAEADVQAALRTASVADNWKL